MVRCADEARQTRCLMKNESMEKTVNKIAAEVEKNTGAIDGITAEVVKNTEAIKGLVTREEFSEFKQEYFARLDSMMTILNRLNQERVFTFEAVKVEKQRHEINQIKEVLKIQ